MMFDRPLPKSLTAQDIRKEAVYRKCRADAKASLKPGKSHIADATEVSASPCGRWAGFTAIVHHDLESTPRSQVCIADLVSGKIERLVNRSNNDRCVRWSPDGKWIAFLSDRYELGNFQLFLRSTAADASDLETPVQNGTIESFCWSWSGSRLLMIVAGFGGEQPGVLGGAAFRFHQNDVAPWMPEIEGSGIDRDAWRSLVVLDVTTGQSRTIGPAELNIWEAAWLGEDRIVAVGSDSYTEASWYAAKLYTIDVEQGDAQLIYEPRYQLGIPQGARDGRRAAVIDAFCSDRMLASGDLVTIEIETGTARTVDTASVAVSDLHWTMDGALVFAGERSLECVAGTIDSDGEQVRELWASRDCSLSGWHSSCYPIGHDRVVAITEAFDMPPALVMIDDSGCHVVHAFGGKPKAGNGFSIEPVKWQHDELMLEGWLLKPPGNGPFPMILDIHGGPVWQNRNRWIGRNPGAQQLLAKGIAYFLPNPRGSSGRGVAFAHMVQGDMGGGDMHDLLAGMDHLVEAGIADPAKLGVTGVSYGGFMTAWIVTQDQRFAAAVPVSPISNWFSQHWTSQIPAFDTMMFGGPPQAAHDKFLQKSPALFAEHVSTPVMQLTGGLDRNTPPTQALEFHRSLEENGATSICLTYPEAGHSIRSYPEIIDHTARKIAWFLHYLRPDLNDAADD